MTTWSVTNAQKTSSFQLNALLLFSYCMITNAKLLTFYSIRMFHKAYRMFYKFTYSL